MEREKIREEIEKIAKFITADKLKNVTEFVLARENFIHMIQAIIDKSNLKCEIKNTYVGEVSAAQFELGEQTYLAVDCVIRKNENEEWIGDTLFIPMEYITEEKESKKLYTGIKLLSEEVEKDDRPTLLN